MTIQSYSTSDLCKELLRRAEHTDALLALVNGAGSMSVPKPPVERPRRPKRISFEDFMDAFAKIDKPTVVDALARKLHLTKGTVHGQIHRGVREGRIMVHGKGKPHAYSMNPHQP